MNIIVITAPPVEPVTLAEVWDHLRLTPTGTPPAHPHDAMLERHIVTARAEAERITKRAFVEQSLRLTMEAFPACGEGIDLLRPPLRAVSTVRYYDNDNVLQTVLSSDYYTTDDMVPRLMFVEGWSAPVTYDRPDAVLIDYVAGYPPADSPPTEYVRDIPDGIKSAILLGVELLYNPLKPDDRETIERARDALLVGYTVPKV